VDTHRASIRRKLGLKSGTELIHRAVQWVGTQS
jgi:DNA-binding CsgD family transcriptional regulator